MIQKLFPTDLPELQWRQFEAKGFSQPVSGVIYHADRPPCCGMPLGGISTGCVDIDPRGVFGFNSIFNPGVTGLPGRRGWHTRKLPRIQPFLGLAMGAQTWVLASEDMIQGENLPWCTEPRALNALRETEAEVETVRCPKLEGVQPATQIHYWGHYPVADMEFAIEAPISVGLRAWSPFFPGDAAASNIPAAVFEIHLRNRYQVRSPYSR